MQRSNSLPPISRNGGRQYIEIPSPPHLRRLRCGFREGRRFSIDFPHAVLDSYTNIKVSRTRNGDHDLKKNTSTHDDNQVISTCCSNNKKKNINLSHDANKFEDPFMYAACSIGKMACFGLNKDNLVIENDLECCPLEMCKSSAKSRRSGRSKSHNQHSSQIQVESSELNIAKPPTAESNMLVFLEKESRDEKKDQEHITEKHCLKLKFDGASDKVQKFRKLDKCIQELNDIKLNCAIDGSIDSPYYSRCNYINDMGDVVTCRAIKKGKKISNGDQSSDCGRDNTKKMTDTPVSIETFKSKLHHQVKNMEPLDYNIVDMKDLDNLIAKYCCLRDNFEQDFFHRNKKSIPTKVKHLSVTNENLQGSLKDANELFNFEFEMDGKDFEDRVNHFKTLQFSPTPCSNYSADYKVRNLFPPENNVSPLGVNELTQPVLWKRSNPDKLSHQRLFSIPDKREPKSSNREPNEDKRLNRHKRAKTVLESAGFKPYDSNNSSVACISIQLPSKAKSKIVSKKKACSSSSISYSPAHLRQCMANEHFYFSHEVFGNISDEKGLLSVPSNEKRGLFGRGTRRRGILDWYPKKKTETQDENAPIDSRLF